MSVHEMLQWWNVIYLAPLLVSLVWITVTVISGGHMGSSHGHAGAHDISHGIGHAAHEIGHAVGNAIHHGHGGDAGHAGHAHAHGHDHGHDAHGHGQDNSAMSRVLWILGIGQIPITLMIGIFLLCWGAFGMVMNQFFEGILKVPAVYIWPSIGATFVVSSLGTRVIAAIVARVLPTNETYGVSRVDLVGSVGKTVFSTTETTGTVDIKDAYGTVHRVQARAEEGGEPIPSGKEVIVLDFDEQDKRFVVRISDI